MSETRRARRIRSSASLPFLIALAASGGLFAPVCRAQSGAALAAAPAAAPASPSTTDAASWEAKIASFRKERVDELSQEDSWLTLVGLFWLDPGENRFGSDIEGKVIFPAGKLPKRAGILIRDGEKVKIKADPEAKLTSGGKPVTEMDLVSDNQGEPTVLESGSISFFVVQRGDKVGIRIKDSQSEVRRTFKGLDTFPADSAWRITARFEPYDPPKKVAIPNVLGQVTDSPSPGALVFEWQGKSYRLDALGAGADKPLSLIFGDKSNGHETYGAGRFLETEAPKDGKVVVDFNLAYNPPCAFTAFATCPLPPPQNKLAIAVLAGEKKFAGGPHH